MDTFATRSHFWRPVRVGLAVIGVLMLVFWLFTPKDRYEPPINGQYNSPANDSYERAYEDQQDESYPDKSDAERLGEEVGNGWNGVKDAGKDFWSGVQSTAK